MNYTICKFKGHYAIQLDIPVFGQIFLLTPARHLNYICNYLFGHQLAITILVFGINHQVPIHILALVVQIILWL